jgi:exosome complex RNA-binding protein Rrp42 (RNase PH superfamily)
VETARFTVGITEDGFVTALQKGLNGTFKVEELLSLIDHALEKGTQRIKEMKTIIENGSNWVGDSF